MHSGNNLNGGSMHSGNNLNGGSMHSGGMNDSAAALHCSTDGLLNDIMGDEMLDPAALLNEDPTDATSWGLDALGKLSNDKDLSNGSV